MKGALKAVRAAWKLEFSSDLGKINAIGVCLTFLFISAASVSSVYEATLARLLPSGHSYSFPAVVLALVFVGSFLVCVVILALVQIFAPPARR